MRGLPNRHPDLPVRPLAEAAAAPGGFVATVPGELAPVYAVDLPDGLRHGPRERIARRQIAERLGLAEDRLDIRPLGQGAGWHRVVVCDADRSAAWRAELAGTGCAGIVPDYLALDGADGVWTIRCQDGRITARLGADDGFAAETGLALALLRRALAAAAPAAVLVLGTPHPDLTALFAPAEIAVFDDPAALTRAGFDAPRPHRGALAVNLLETADARVERLRAGLRRWRLPAIAAGLALALWSTGTMVLIDRDRARAAAIRQTTETLLRDTFIPDGPILDIRLQVSRRRAQIGAAAAGDGDGPAPIELFRRAAARIDGGGVALQSVRYRTQTGLEAALTSPDFARVDALAEALRADGLRVVVLEAQADEGGTVRARMRLGGA